MNVMTVCLSPALGGLELYALRSARMLAKQNRVTAVLVEQARLMEKFSASAIGTIALRDTFKPLPVLRARQLAGLLDELDIDAVHMHWGKDLPLVSLARKYSRRKPAVVYTRQMQITRPKRDYYHQLQYREVALILCITEALRSDVRKYLAPEHSAKVHTLYYGVDEPDRYLTEQDVAATREELGFDRSDFVIGLIGRLEQQKGQHLMIEAIAQAERAGCSDASALIVGHEMTPGYRDGLRARARSLGLGERVRFKDFVSDPQRLMQACDCVALTTYEETFGLVLPEAMRAGVCVIGSNRGGVPEIIDHGQTGLLFESGSAEDLSRQIVSLRHDPALLERLAAEGKRKADRLFNADTHSRQLNEFFLGAVN